MNYDIDDKPEIKLPFEGDDFDIGEWAYSHRVGLSVTLIIYLIMAIGFMSVKVTLEMLPQYNAIAIDLQQLAELERQRDELKESVERMKEQEDKTLDWSSVQNRASNENALDERVKDDRNTDVDQLLKDAAEFQNRMAQNRAAYESGVAEANAIKERGFSSSSKSEESGERRDSKVSGNVTVSYYFVAPTRHALLLTVPAYQCEGGGEVVLSVVLNQSGRVTSAKVTRGGDECMQQTALNAALSSHFNVDTSAPARQTGRITYIFVAQ